MRCWHFLLVCLVISFADCSERKFSDASEMTDWKSMDSVFKYIITKPGKEKFAKGDPIALQLTAVLGNNGTKKIDTSSIPAGCIQFAYNIASETILTNEKGIINRYEEGLLRADFSAIKFRKDFKVVVYLRKVIEQYEIDSLMNHLRKFKEVRSATFISKEEAKKRWLASGEADFPDYLDENPLPVSIELLIEPEYLEESILKDLAASIESRYSLQVDSVSYNIKLVQLFDCLRKSIFLFSYKT